MHSPGDEELSDEHERRAHEDAIRRATLYGVSAKQRLPRVSIAPRDARTKRELQVLFAPQQLVFHSGLSVYEDEQEQRKHHDHLGIRPALDQSQPLQDLFTTVPRHLTTQPSVDALPAKREWRVGYKNDPQSDTHGGGRRGVFEPTDSVREALIHTPGYKATSTALAYPPPVTSLDQVAQQLVPQDAEKDRKEMEAKLRAGMLSDVGHTKPHWSPASLGIPATVPDSKRTKTKMKQRPAAAAVNQRYTVRKEPSPLQKIPLTADERCVAKRQAQVQSINEAYTTLQQQADRAKDPALRYSLPIENPASDRAYRLGLDPVPSSSESITKSSKPLLFRPKSAVTLGVTTALSPVAKLNRCASSTASLLVPSASPGKVAGAKRRPHSATVSYLSNSTVYCMETPVPSSSPSAPLANAHEVIKQQRKYGAAFLSSVLQERARRQQTQTQFLTDLANRGVLHSIPVPQIFARLRREAMKNLSKRVEQARYDRLSMDEYMSLCGMAAVAGPVHEELHIRSDPDPDDDDPLDPEEADQEDEEDPVIQELRDQLELRQLAHDTEPPGAVFRKRKAIRPDPVDGNNSSTVLAIRRALFVTREQFHIAMEAFALASRDVNLFYSAVDVAVTDVVPVWQLICAVEQLQEGHEELRRARVQVKAGKHLPKELESLRRSVAFPHTTHVPLPLGSL